MATSSRSPKSTELAHASTPELFAGVIADAKELAVGHFGRMRGEISDEFTNLKRIMMLIAAATGVVIVGAVLLGHALAFGLAALGLPVWAGYLVASTLMVGLGILVLKRMPRDTKESDLVPEAALANLMDDVADVRRAAQAP